MVWPILAVRDFDASVEFYKKLGFEREMALPGPDGRNAFGSVRLGQASFGLSRVADLERRGEGVSFMVYVPDDIDLDAHYAQVQANGVAVEAAIQTQYWGDRTFAVRDPDGYHISLCKTVRQVPMDQIEAAMRGEKTPA